MNQRKYNQQSKERVVPFDIVKNLGMEHCNAVAQLNGRDRFVVPILADYMNKNWFGPEMTIQQRSNASHEVANKIIIGVQKRSIRLSDYSDKCHVRAQRLNPREYESFAMEVDRICRIKGYEFDGPNYPIESMMMQLAILEVSKKYSAKPLSNDDEKLLPALESALDAIQKAIEIAKKKDPT